MGYGSGRGEVTLEVSLNVDGDWPVVKLVPKPLPGLWPAGEGAKLGVEANACGESECFSTFERSCEVSMDCILKCEDVGVDCEEDSICGR